VAVAAQLGNAPDVADNTYSHEFSEVGPEARWGASAALEAARAEFGVREMYADLGLLGSADSPKTPFSTPSRRADSNRGPLHSEIAAAFVAGCGPGR
jgi:hypothetical protein